MPFLLPAHVLQPNSGAVQVGSALHRQPGTVASGAGVSAASSGSQELIGKLSALSLRSLRSAASHGAHSLARLRQQVRGASARSSPRASAAQNCCSSCRPTSPERPKTAPSGATAPARGDVLVSSRSHRVSTGYLPPISPATLGRSRSVAPVTAHAEHHPSRLVRLRSGPLNTWPGSGSGSGPGSGPGSWWGRA